MMTTVAISYRDVDHQKKLVFPPGRVRPIGGTANSVQVKRQRDSARGVDLNCLT